MMQECTHPGEELDRMEMFKLVYTRETAKGRVAVNEDVSQKIVSLWVKWLWICIFGPIFV